MLITRVRIAASLAGRIGQPNHMFGGGRVRSLHPEIFAMGHSHSRFVPLFVGALLLLGAAGAFAQSDSVVLVGVGQSGTWVTEMIGANPAESPLLAQVSTEPRFEPPAPCPDPCPFVYFGLGSNGTQALDPILVSRVAAGEVVTTLYVTPENGKPLPSIRARVLNTARPEQAISAPAF